MGAWVGGVGGEEGDVEGVVLGDWGISEGYVLRERGMEAGGFTCLPMIPMQAMEGMDILFVVWQDVAWGV